MSIPIVCLANSLDNAKVHMKELNNLGIKYDPPYSNKTFSKPTDHALFLLERIKAEALISIAESLKELNEQLKEAK